MPILMPMYADAGALLDRMRALFSKPFSVNITVSRPDLPAKATGSLIIQRPNRMRFKIKSGPDDFEVGFTEDGVIDLSRSQRIYMETGPLERLYAPNAHYSDLPDHTFPLVVLIGDPRAQHPEAGTPQITGSAAIGGVVCSQVHTKMYDAWIADDGRLMRYKNKSALGGRVVDVTTDFTNYKVGGTFPRSSFDLRIPSGFRPFVLPRETMTFQAGSLFPANDWVALTGAPIKFESGKPYLVMVTSGDCEVSSRAKGALATLKKDMPVWVLTDSRAPAGLEGFAAARDKSGRTLERMFLPVTPFFYLVDKDGKIKKLWMGFETDRENAFIKDVRTAAGS